MDYISFNDLLPSRFAMSFIPETNSLATWINVAFIALDSEKLGISSEATVHVDFGDNKFPHYLGNKKTASFEHEEAEEEGEDDIKVHERSFLSDEQIAALSKYIPTSIMSFLSVNFDNT